MESRHPTLGLIPIGKFIFSKEAALEQKRRIEAVLEALSIEYVTIDSVVEDGLLYRPEDVSIVVERMRAAAVDGVFVPHCNFGTEGVVGMLGRQLQLPLLLWGPQDDPPNPDGSRDRDSLCGVFASSKVLRKLGVPFHHVPNCAAEDQELADGLHTFLRAASVARTFAGVTLGAIGSRVDFFWSTIINESDLLERFNVEVLPIELPHIISEARRRASEDREQYEEESVDLKKKVRMEGFATAEQLHTLLALRDTLIVTVRENDLAGIAIHNLGAVVAELGVDLAFALSLTCDAGIPVAMESDIHGLLSSVLLQRATGKTTPTFISDVTIRHPSVENGFLLWHNSFPLSYADPSSRPTVGVHWLWRSEYPGMTHWRIKPGRITIARFDEADGEYRLASGVTDTIDGPYTQNTYQWVEVDDWRRWEEQLVYGPYMHHVSCAYGHHIEALRLACRFVPGLTFEALGGKCRT